MLGYVGYPGSSPLQLSADLLRGRGLSALRNRRPRVLKKIMIVLGIIIVWEQRDNIVPVVESVVTYVSTTGSTFVQSL